MLVLGFWSRARPSEIDIPFENQLLAYYWTLVEVELSSGKLELGTQLFYIRNYLL